MSQKLLRCCCPDTNVLVYVLVILFGVASWVDINGLWVELPILVQHLPEGWDLPSYMAVIIQVANVAPLLYTITSAIWPHRRIEVPVIYVIISVGIVSCLLLALFWDKTSSVAGTEHSTALFTLQFFLALVDCTSSVAFLPFMSVFKPQYMIAYFIGEGFSGLIPSLVSLGQGAGSMKCVAGSWSEGNNNNNNNTTAPTAAFNSTSNNIMNFYEHAGNHPSNGTFLVSGFEEATGLNLNNLNVSMSLLAYNLSSSPSPVLASSTAAVTDVIQKYPVYQAPRFTVQTFFLFLMGLLMASLASFTLLNYWSYCKKEYVVVTNRRNEIEATETFFWQDEDEEDGGDGDESDTNNMTSSMTVAPIITTITNNKNVVAYTRVEITEIPSHHVRPPLLSNNKHNTNTMTSLIGDDEEDSSSNPAAPPQRAKIYNPNNNKRGSGRKAQCCNGGKISRCRSYSSSNGNNTKSARGLVATRNSSTSTNLSLAGTSSVDSSELDDPKRETMMKKTKKISKAKYALYLILTAWINALVCGVLPSIQTYSCLPYGIRPYHLSVTLASISNPVACFAALFLEMTSTKATALMTFLGSALSGYLVLTAAMSPAPPLVHHYGGGLVVILAWVIVVFFLTYTKVSIGMVFRREGRRALLWVGAFTQVGALVGALAIFFIINYHHLFQWANPCM